MKLWRRVILKDLVGSFLFVLGCVFVLYVIIDLAEKAKDTRSWAYYLGTFSLYFDLFIPLAFLLASLKVLFHLNTRQLLIALQMSGLSKKTILAPFFFLSLVLAFLSCLNAELFFPKAYEMTAPLKKKKQTPAHLFSATLDEGSQVIYQNYNPTTQELFDVVWIQDKNHISLMKHLALSDPPLARDIHHLIRTTKWEKLQSAPEQILPNLHINPALLSERPAQLQSRSPSSLFQQLRSKIVNRAAIKSHLFYKLFRTFLSPFLLFFLAPMAMRFSRNHSLFLSFSSSLLGFFCFMTILDGMLILAETGALPALVAIGGPFTLCFIYSFRPFIKL